MHGTHGIYNVTLQVILANAFIIGGGMLEHSVPTCPGLCYLYSHMAHSLCLLVKCAKTILLYNPQDSDLNDV